MRSLTTKGIICLQDDYNLLYRIADIFFTEWEDGHFKYSFYPNYEVTDMLPSHLYQGIPGLDLSLGKACYERENIVPTFISERTPSESREDLWQILKESGMKALNRLEWLINTNKRYSGDKFFVIPYQEKNIIKKDSMYELVSRSDSINKKILEIICFGDDLYTKEIIIDKKTRIQYYNFLYSIYQKEFNRRKNLQQRGIDRARMDNRYTGRLSIKLDPLFFDRVANDYYNNKISSEMAAQKLGISKATFFRRLRHRK